VHHIAAMQIHARWSEVRCGTVGAAPLRKKPSNHAFTGVVVEVEFHRDAGSHAFIAETSAPVPRALAPAFWIVNVSPSAMFAAAGVIWKLKSVVKFCTLTGVALHTARASLLPPFVSSRALPLSAAPPTRLRPALLVKPRGD